MKLQAMRIRTCDEADATMLARLAGIKTVDAMRGLLKTISRKNAGIFVRMQQYRFWLSR
jgi:hypothetical protein